MFLLSSTALTACIFAALPSSADDYSHGAAAYSSGDFAGAKAHLIKATQLKPKSWQAFYQLGNTYVQLKDSANAKIAYQKCIANHPPADVQANCTNALSYIASNPKLTAPVAVAAPRPVQMIAPKSAAGSTASSSESGEGPSAAPVSADLEIRRARIIQDAEAEVNRMKAQEKERQSEAEDNANQRYLYPDGTVKTSLSNEEIAQMQREVEQKAAVIRDRAKKRAADLR